MYNVAVLFRDGIGVDRDEKSAVEWSAVCCSSVAAWVWVCSRRGLGSSFV
jgi:hypothetical protein